MPNTIACRSRRSRFSPAVQQTYSVFVLALSGYVWIPPHNKNHHLRRQNRREAITLSRLSGQRKNNDFLLCLNCHPSNSYFQQSRLRNYHKNSENAQRPARVLSCRLAVSCWTFFSRCSDLWCQNWQEGRSVHRSDPHQVSLFSVLIFQLRSACPPPMNRRCAMQP